MTRPLAEYVLIQPQEGLIHAITGVRPCCTPIWCACGKVIGDRWRIVRSYKLRGNARREATCPKCKAALSSGGDRTMIRLSRKEMAQRAIAILLRAEAHRASLARAEAEANAVDDSVLLRADEQRGVR